MRLRTSYAGSVGLKKDQIFVPTKKPYSFPSNLVGCCLPVSQELVSRCFQLVGCVFFPYVFHHRFRSLTLGVLFPSLCHHRCHIGYISSGSVRSLLYWGVYCFSWPRVMVGVGVG